jgi:hypothetical protein
VPFVAGGPRQVASIHRPAHRPWCAIGRRSGARRRPSRDLSTRARVIVVTSLAPNRPPAPIKTRPGRSSRARAPTTEPRRSPLAPPVRTSFPSTSSPTQVPNLFLVHHKSSPGRLLIKPSRTIAGARAPAAAAGLPPSSSPILRSSAPGDLPSAFPRPHGGSRCSTLLSIAPSLTVVRAPAAAPPLRRHRRSPATFPAEPPPPINHW